jgi:thermitase
MTRFATVLTLTAFISAALFTGCSSTDPGIAGLSVTPVAAAVESAPSAEPSTHVEATPTASAIDVQNPPPAGLTVTAADYDLIAGRWGVERINVSAAWDEADGFRGVLVAVLDTGIASDAPFAHRIMASMDFTGIGSTEDEHGHGTHMAGTIAAIAPNANLLNARVADRRGRCSTPDVARAIRWAADRGAQVINISLEVAPSPELERAVNYAWERGAIVVAAAGNSGSTTPAFPAAYVTVMAVAGTNQSDGLAVLSNHGDWVDIAAPGFKIYAERPGNELGYETGTSPAAAHVSGVAALLFGVATDTSGNGYLNDEVRAALESTAQALSAPGTGCGLVDACSAVRYFAWRAASAGCTFLPQRANSQV